MNNFDETEMGGRFLPGVDLNLWLRLVVALLFAVALGGIAVAVF